MNYFRFRNYPPHSRRRIWPALVCVRYRERRVLNDLTVVNSVSTEPVWIRIRIPNSGRGGANSFSMKTIVQLTRGWIEYIIFWINQIPFFMDNFYCARGSNERIFLFFFLKIVISIRLYIRRIKNNTKIYISYRSNIQCRVKKWYIGGENNWLIFLVNYFYDQDILIL